MKHLLIITILFSSVTAFAQTESFAYKMPKPKNNTYHFEVVAGVGVSNIEAQNDAYTKMKHHQANRLWVPFGSISEEMLFFACDSIVSSANLGCPDVCDIPANKVYWASSFMHFLKDGRNCIHILFLVPENADVNVKFDTRTFPKIWKWGKKNGDIIMKNQEICETQSSYKK